MPIEDVFSIKGRGTVGTGRIERGKVKIGDTVEIVGLKPTPRPPSSPASSSSRRRWTRASPATTSACCSAASKRKTSSAARCSRPQEHHPAHQVRGEVYVLTKEEGGRHTPFFTGYRPQFYFRTTDVTGAAKLLGGAKWSCPATT
jgi:elongation factor Tu